MKHRRIALIVAFCSITLIGCIDQSVDPAYYWDDSLLSASSEGYTSTVVGLLNQGANVNARDEGERTPLINAAGNNHVEIIKVLLERGAQVNAQNHNGDTALDVTSSNEIRRLLKAKGAKRGDKKKVVPH